MAERRSKVIILGGIALGSADEMNDVPGCVDTADSHYVYGPGVEQSELDVASGIVIGTPPHELAEAFKLIHSAIGSFGLYPKRSRHLDWVPSELVTLGNQRRASWSDFGSHAQERSKVAQRRRHCLTRRRGITCAAIHVVADTSRSSDAGAQTPLPVIEQILEGLCVGR